MTFDENEKSGKKIEELKTFAITGWVQVEVYTYVKAKNLKDVEKFLKKNPDPGNTELWFEEGNWASGITVDEDPKEATNGEEYNFPQALHKVNKKGELE